MPRNSAVIRQWKLLLHLDQNRLGASVDDLARDTGCGKRTIWRDMQALQDVGFPLTSEKREGGRTHWQLLRMPLKAVHDPGLSVTEICSLHMGRALLQAMPGAAFADGLAGLLKKIDRALTPRMRAFLDGLPGVVQVKPGALKRHQKDYAELVARLIGASVEHRVSRMRYYSASNDREKDYVVHPYSVAYFDGGLYLTAYVPEYRQVRVFAAERVRSFSTTDERFEPQPPPSGVPFGDSLGVNQGRTERVEIAFAARVAPYIRERTWHASQQVRELPDGGVRLTLKVCRDWALRGWILSFGPHARVVSPSALATEILDQLEDARSAYAPRLAFEPQPAYLLAQPRLPMRS